MRIPTHNNINLYRVTWQPIVTLILSFLIIMGVISQYNHWQQKENLNKELNTRFTNHYSSIINELFLNRKEALEIRLVSIVNDINILYPDALICARLFIDHNAVKFKNIEYCNDNMPINKWSNPTTQFITLMIGGNEVGNIELTTTIPLSIKTYFSVGFFFAMFISIILAFLSQILLVNKLQKSIVTPLLNSIKRDIRAITIAETGEQVAHDIRSPLVALDMALKGLSEIPEKRRVIIRSAMQRIKDIINNLQQAKNQYDIKTPPIKENTLTKPELLSILVEYLISEKRTELADKIIHINLDIADNCYSIFSKVNAVEFKRLLSNIINNAYESIDSKTGVIDVGLKTDGKHICMQIQDNGHGIPENILSKIFEPGFTKGKQNGSGLGLSHAKKFINYWGGKISVDSNLSVGTTITIHLPVTKPPQWFMPSLSINKNDILVIVDDDDSIHHVWEQRFERLDFNKANIKIINFKDGIKFSKWYNSIDHKENLHILIDYELIGQDKNGIDIIEKLNIYDKAILVTSRFEENKIQNRCCDLNIKIIPKPYSMYIPIYLTREVGLVFIDDDSMMTNLWEFRAESINKKIATFNDPNEFLKDINNFNYATPIYIDSNLGENISGENFAKRLYEMGFKKLYLATGHDPKYFNKMFWITDIIGKEPPF